MTDVETILKMIETVDPADSAKLDEIDRAVYQFVDGSPLGWTVIPREMRYSRSRDALKSIRPRGWNFAILPLSDGTFCCRGSYGDPNRTDGPDSDNLRSEELAELYVIVQAVAHDRAREIARMVVES